MLDQSNFRLVLFSAVIVVALLFGLACRSAADDSPAATRPVVTTTSETKGPDGSASVPHRLEQNDPQATHAKLAVTKAQLDLYQDLLDAREGKQNVTTINSQLSMVMSVLHLVDDKPAAIVKEPAYLGKAAYGAFRIGDGSKSVTYLAVDIQSDGSIGKIYIDLNQNGDLTDDGSDQWDTKRAVDGVMGYYKTVTLHASWGSPVQESESGKYTLFIHIADGLKGLTYTRLTARAGSIQLGDKIYPVVVGEGGNDGNFIVPAIGERSRKSLLVYVDTDGSVPVGTSTPMIDPTNKHHFDAFDASRPAEVDGHWYMFRTASVSGSGLLAFETSTPSDNSKPPKIAPLLLPNGMQAPDFTVQTPDGKPLRLSDLRGKVVLLDFWATWCGPCQRSMPELERVYQQIKNQNAVLLSVCVQDDRDAFDKWTAQHAGKDYNFTIAYDPAARGPDSIANAKYNVNAIPTQFIIGPDGKIAGSMQGADNNQRKLIDTLKSLGIQATG